MSATPSANRIVCKLEFNGDIRRFHLESPSFSEVVRIAARRFSLSESDLLRVVFADPDGDLITINDDSSLEEAISCSGQVLRLSLVPSATPLPLSPRAEKKPSASVARDTERIEAKIAALREARIMLARRGTCVGRWAQRAREGEANERIDKVRQKLASRVAEVQARADKLSAKFPEFAARFQHAASEPTQAELREFVEKHAPRITCDGCQAQITLSETRFNCEDCFDFDLCAACEAKAEHDPSHVLRKMLPEAQQVQPIFMNRHCRRFAARHGAPHHSFSRHGDAPSPFGPFVAVPLAHPSGDAPFPPFAAGPHHHHHHRGHHRGSFAAGGAPHHHQRGPFGGPHHQYGPFGAPHPHRGGPCRGFGGGFGGFGAHCAEKQEKTKRTPQDSRAAIEALLKEKIVPQLAAFPLLGSIPLMDIAAEILDLLEAQAPNLLKRVHCVLARLAVGAPLNMQAIAHRLEKSGLLTPELVAALQEVLHRHLGDLDISLDSELFQSAVASFCNAQRSNRRSPPGFSRCPRFNNAPAPAPAAEPVAPEAEVPAAPQPDLSASVALAAMSVPADVIEQLLAQTNGNLELAATLWEAMQE